MRSAGPRPDGTSGAAGSAWLKFAPGAPALTSLASWRAFQAAALVNEDEMPSCDRPRTARYWLTSATTWSAQPTLMAGQDGSGAQSARDAFAAGVIASPARTVR